MYTTIMLSIIMLTVSTKFYKKFPLSIEISIFIDTPRVLILLYVVPRVITYKRVSLISDIMYRSNFKPNQTLATFMW